MTDDAILAALVAAQGPKSAKELADIVGGPSSRVRAALEQATTAGAVIKRNRASGKRGRPVVEYLGVAQ
jgi:predicted ArsR family transcriptional regulator